MKYIKYFLILFLFACSNKNTDTSKNLEQDTFEKDLIKYENILIEDMNFEVKIYDRYQRLIHESFIQSSDKVWDGMNIDSSGIVKTDFYFYEITPVEYYNTPYVRRRDKLVGTVYLEKER